MAEQTLGKGDVMLASGEIKKKQTLVTAGPKKNYVSAWEFAKLKKNPLKKIMALLVHPHKNIEERVDRRRVRILSAVSLCFFICLVVFNCIQSALWSDWNNTIGSIAGMVLVLIAYIVSRTDAIDLATWTNIVGMLLIPTIWGGFYSASSKDPAAIMIWFLVPPAVSACTQKWNSMIMSGVLNIVLFYMTVALAQIDLTYARHVQISVIMQTLYLWMAAYTNKRDLKLLDEARRKVDVKEETPLSAWKHLGKYFFTDSCLRCTPINSLKSIVDINMPLTVILHPSHFILGDKERRRARIFSAVAFAYVWIELYYLEEARLGGMATTDIFGFRVMMFQWWTICLAYLGSRTRYTEYAKFFFGIFTGFQFMLMGGLIGANAQFTTSALSHVAQIVFFCSTFMNGPAFAVIVMMNLLAAFYIPTYQDSVTYPDMASSLTMLVCITIAVIGYRIVWQRDVREAEMSKVANKVRAQVGVIRGFKNAVKAAGENKEGDAVIEMTEVAAEKKENEEKKEEKTEEIAV